MPNNDDSRLPGSPGFLEKDHLANWCSLNTEPAVATIVARTSLRFLPKLELTMFDLSGVRAERKSAEVLMNFDLLATIWAYSRYPAFSSSLADAIEIKTSMSPADLESWLSSPSQPIAEAAILIRDIHREDTIGSGFRRRRIIDYMSKLADSMGDDSPDYWSRIIADTEAIDEGWDPSSLAETAIWGYAELVPWWVRDRWDQQESLLLASNMGWEVWTEWYDNRLTGEIYEPELDLDRILNISETDWVEGPKHVNTVIRQRMDDIRERIQDQVEKPDLTMREFIIRLLDDSEFPLSIDEIAEQFENSGYTSQRASIRGRLNSLTAEGLIQRVSRGTYASEPHIGLGDTPLEADAPPEIPDQKAGLAFEISVNGKIGFADTGLVSDNDEAEQVESMRVVLLEATDDLLGATQGSNAFSNLNRIAQQYRTALAVPIGKLSLDRLYAQGIRLDNANNHLKAEIARGDLPDTGLTVGEALDSVLAIHGPTILSTVRGQQLLQRSRQYNSSRDEELAYKEKALKVIHAATQNLDLVEHEVKEVIEPINAEIGEGRFPERSFDLARQANQNLLSAIAKPVVWALSSIAAQSVITSIPGAHFATAGAQLLDTIYLFLQANSNELRALAVVAGQELSWLTAFLDWWERRKK